MVTGASTAQVAIILIDASRVEAGRLLVQTKRHSALTRLLGIKHIVVAVNKMDLVDWSEDVFRRIRDAYRDLADTRSEERRVGKVVAGSVGLGGRRIIKKQKTKK